MKIRFWAYVLGFMFCVGSAEAKLFGAEDFYLDNGMQVIVVPNHKAPIIRQMVWYKAGSADESLGKGGVAHLLEHLMFRGTKKVKDSEFNRIVTENGAESNAFTSLDYTAYYEVMDISKLELAMLLEADRMRNLDISRESFEKERDIVFQERKQVVENNPASYFSETFRRYLWQEHPYSRPVTGMPEEIQNLTLDDVYDFYRRYYAPNNAILVLSGDIDVETAKELSVKYFAGLKPTKNITKTFFPVLDKFSKTYFEMKLPRINAVRMTQSCLAPSYNTDKSRIYALAVFSRYLGEGETSKLYKKLVVERKSALSVSASYDFASRSYGSFTVSALPKENIDADEFQKELKQAIAEAVAEITLDEIENTKQKMLAGQVYLLDNPNDAAYIAGSLAGIGMSLEDIENQADYIRSVNYKDVIAEAKDLFENSSCVLGVLKPAEGGENV